MDVTRNASSTAMIARSADRMPVEFPRWARTRTFHAAHGSAISLDSPRVSGRSISDCSRHQHAYLRHIDGAAGCRARQSSSGHNCDLIPQHEDFFELRRNVENRAPEIAQQQNLVENEPRGTGIEPPCRLECKKQFRLAANFAREDNLLLVAAGE